MQINFEVKIDEFLGTIYEFPIMKVSGSFNETEVDEFIAQLSKDIKVRVINYINKKKEK